jgi:hypothetical protein
MAHAKYPGEVAERIYNILEAAKATIFADWPLVAADQRAVMYGDQKRLPITPMICVEAGETRAQLQGAQNMTLNDHVCYIMIFHSIVQDVQLNKRQSEVMGEKVTYLLEQNLRLEYPTLGTDGKVIHGHVASFDPGYSFKEGTLYSSVRLTWVGKSKTRLGA